MKLALFTPLDGSAIAMRSVAVAEALQHLGHEVQLWTPSSRTSVIKTRLSITDFGRWPIALQKLSPDHSCLYVLDGSVRDDERILEVASVRPGLVILDRPTDRADPSPPVGSVLGVTHGVVCHSRTGAEQIRRCWAGPVRCLEGLSADAYAEELATFVLLTVRLAPVLALTDRAGRALADLGIPVDSPAASAVRRALHGIRAPTGEDEVVRP